MICPRTGQGGGAEVDSNAAETASGRQQEGAAGGGISSFSGLRIGWKVRPPPALRLGREAVFAVGGAVGDREAKRGSALLWRFAAFDSSHFLARPNDREKVKSQSAPPAREGSSCETRPPIVPTCSLTPRGRAARRLGSAFAFQNDPPIPPPRRGTSCDIRPNQVAELPFVPRRGSPL